MAQKVEFVETECSILRKAIGTMANVVAEEMDELKKDIGDRVAEKLARMTKDIKDEQKYALEFAEIEQAQMKFQIQ